jgi:hypothetical protein
MDPAAPAPQSPGIVKGKTGLIAAALVVLVLVIAFRAFRWFLLISAAIGIIVAGMLFLWHKLRPVKEEQVDNKHPLGLQ